MKNRPRIPLINPGLQPLLDRAANEDGFAFRVVTRGNKKVVETSLTDKAHRAKPKGGKQP